MALFPSTYIHVGGDEAVKDQWQASPAVQAKMRALGLARRRRAAGLVHRSRRQYLDQHGRKLIGWDEILEGDTARRRHRDVVARHRGRDQGGASSATTWCCRPRRISTSTTLQSAISPTNTPAASGAGSLQASTPSSRCPPSSMRRRRNMCSVRRPTSGPSTCPTFAPRRARGLSAAGRAGRSGLVAGRHARLAELPRPPAGTVRALPRAARRLCRQRLRAGHRHRSQRWRWPPARPGDAVQPGRTSAPPLHAGRQRTHACSPRYDAPFDVKLAGHRARRQLRRRRQRAGRAARTRAGSRRPAQPARQHLAELSRQRFPPARAAHARRDASPAGVRGERVRHLPAVPRHADGRRRRDPCRCRAPAAQLRAGARAEAGGVASARHAVRRAGGTCRPMRRAGAGQHAVAGSGAQRAQLHAAMRRCRRSRASMRCA